MIGVTKRITKERILLGSHVYRVGLENHTGVSTHGKNNEKGVVPRVTKNGVDIKEKRAIAINIFCLSGF